VQQHSKRPQKLAASAAGPIETHITPWLFELLSSASQLIQWNPALSRMQHAQLTLENAQQLNVVWQLLTTVEHILVHR